MCNLQSSNNKLHIPFCSRIIAAFITLLLPCRKIHVLCYSLRISLNELDKVIFFLLNFTKSSEPFLGINPLLHHSHPPSSTTKMSKKLKKLPMSPGDSSSMVDLSDYSSTHQLEIKDPLRIVKRLKKALEGYEKQESDLREHVLNAYKMCK